VCRASLCMVSLEKLVEEPKIMVTGDYHIPFMDKNAYRIMTNFAQDYKPDVFIINGDFLDMYSISTFDKNPERKISVPEEIRQGKEVLTELRKNLGKKCKIYFLEGNHENRLQRYLWRNPELEGLEELKLDHLLHSKEKDINYIKVTRDYWKQDNGHLKIGKNIVVMHGDNRLNGASTSKYSGYSVKNTMMNLQTNVIMGHIHRLALVYHTTPYGDMIGIEGGCLCQQAGTANWQQGFVTFRVSNGKLVNPQLYNINNGKLIVDKKTWK